MKKLLFFVLLFLSFQKDALAKHLKGGWIQYEYLGAKGADSSIYRITVRQYLLCSSTAGAQIDKQINLGIFDGDDNSLLETFTVDSVKNGSVIINKETFSPCLKHPPIGQICYLINKYEKIVTLRNNQRGYILAVQRCCRISGIVNIERGESQNFGITYSNTIPGVINGVSYRNNNSPVFQQKDTALICHNDPFSFDFSATDIATATAPADSIAYTFCAGSTGGSNASNSGKNGVGSIPITPSAPPFAPIPYQFPFDGSSPMGPSVVIDPKTGIISGIAPDTTGDYVVAVCALEFRGGVLIGSTKKEIHITVADCSLSAAKLNPIYSNYTFHFANESTSSANITGYLWDFGDTKNLIDSFLPNSNYDSTPYKTTHIYSDTGAYRFTLKVYSLGDNGGICVDSAKSTLNVYPGFNANFGVLGSCLKNPYYFKDSSITKYGTINSWNWKLGEPNANNDIFSVKDTSYIYPTPGVKSVKLTVGNTKGCFTDTTIQINVRENPQISPLRDTLICVNDTLPLFAKEVNPSGKATFTWSPNKFISDTTSPSPIIYPSDTIKYHLLLSDQGCFATDSITVNTKVSITVKALPVDTAICENDSIHLFADTYGLYFKWTSSNPIEKVDSVKNPLVSPALNLNPTTYSVKAIIGNGNNCFASDKTMVYVYPYPNVNAGEDASICYGTNKTLNGSVSTGATYYWTPNNNLMDSTSLHPIAIPDSTTKYTLTAYYTGKKDACPKPHSDVVKVTVYNKIVINAGNDTTVVVSEPLHLLATGNIDSSTATVLWTTTNTTQDFLDNNNSFHPTASFFGLNTDSVIYVVKATLKVPEKCSATDTMKVLVYQTLPQIFVPTVFTPNSRDGTHRTEKPLPVGVQKLYYFRVFDRYGKMLFSTSKMDEGWNGSYNGEEQPSGTYIYEVKGVDYRGINTLYNKGTFVLIR